MYKSEEIANRIKTLAKQKNIQIKTMLENCDLSKNTLSSMLSGGSTPKSDNLAKIADQLECSIDYLLGRTDNPNKNTPGESIRTGDDKAPIGLDSEDAAFYAEYKGLNESDKDAVRGMVHYLHYRRQKVPGDLPLYKEPFSHNSKVASPVILPTFEKKEDK